MEYPSLRRNRQRRLLLKLWPQKRRGIYYYLLIITLSRVAGYAQKRQSTGTWDVSTLFLTFI